MKNTLKRIAARLSKRRQQELKRLYFGRQIRRGRFRTDEQEYELLPDFVSPGDWVLDVGANVGHYTQRMSQLVGPAGRVIAFEPVPDTFELLAANAALFADHNVTLINAAASAASGVVRMEIQQFQSGLANYYMARITDSGPGLEVLCTAIDRLALPHKVRLAKIDTEGNELKVLQGMVEILRSDHPILIVEDNVPEVPAFLAGFGYTERKLAGSSNRLFYFEAGIGEALRRRLSALG